MEYNKKRITIDQLSSHSFLQTPRELIFNLNKYSNLSAISILTYSLLYDKLSIAVQNQWINEQGELFIKYKKESLIPLIRAKSEDYVTDIFKELILVNLIEEKQNDEIYLLQINMDNYVTVFNQNVISCNENFENVPENKILRYYKNNITSTVSSVEKKILLNIIKSTNDELILKAIDIAVLNNAKNLLYIKTVLKDWENKGLKTIENINVYLKNRTTKKQGNYKKTNFNDYDQRSYNYDDLEKKLLGLE